MFVKIPSFRRANLREILFLVLCTFLLSGCDTKQQRKSMKIGYMICNSREETVQRFAPMTRYLSDKVGVEFELVPVDTHDFKNEYKKQKFDIIHTNSLLYIILREYYGISLIGGEKRGNFGSEPGVP